MNHSKTCWGTWGQKRSWVEVAINGAMVLHHWSCEFYYNFGGSLLLLSFSNRHLLISFEDIGWWFFPWVIELVYPWVLSVPGLETARFAVSEIPNSTVPVFTKFFSPKLGGSFLQQSRGLLGSKVVSTHLWNTPLNLYQNAKEGFLS